MGGHENKLGLALNPHWENRSRERPAWSGHCRLPCAFGADTREDRPLEWAATQNNLGDSLRRLGNRQGGTAQLEEAVLAYRPALEERTRERVPLDWAATQNKLGQALDSRVTRRRDCVSFARPPTHSARRWRNEHATVRRATGPQRSATWGRVVCNRANRGNATPLQAATNAYRAALEVISRDETPFQWGATEFDLASALFQLGGRPEDRGCLIEALDGFEQAKAVFVEAKLDDLANSVTPVITSVKQTSLRRPMPNRS